MGGRQRCALWIASLGGVGRCPWMPGTVGSLVALGVYLMLPLEVGVQLPVVLASLGLGVWSSRVAASVRQQSDPRMVVIDEAVGMWVACFLLPKSLPILLAAFVVFRVLDIVKWFPLNRLERLPGGWGMMADDLAAGLLTRAVISIWV